MYIDTLYTVVLFRDNLPVSLQTAAVYSTPYYAWEHSVLIVRRQAYQIMHNLAFDSTYIETDSFREWGVTVRYMVL
jgi:hypothetical protein